MKISFNKVLLKINFVLNQLHLDKKKRDRKEPISNTKNNHLDIE